MVRSGGQVQLAHGCFDQRLAGCVQIAICSYLGGVHLGIACYALHAFEALSLTVAGSLHARADGGRGLTLAVVGELFVVHSGHFYVDVDAVEQGSRDLLLVAQDGGA